MTTTFYLDRIKNITAELISCKSKMKSIFYARLVVIALMMLVFYLFFNNHPAIVYSLLTVAVFLFFILLKKDVELGRNVNYLHNKIKANETEIDLLDNNYDKLNEGKEFVNPNHHYLSDLDIFGRKSIFQLLNRTTTYTGKIKLADWLTHPFIDKKQIIERQDAIRDLASRLEWCQHYSALGLDNAEKAGDNERIYEWLNEKSYFQNSFYNLIVWLLPAFTLLSIAFYFFNILPIGVFWIFFFIQLSILSFHLKHINLTHDQLSRKVASVQKYANLIEAIETEQFISEKLNSIKNNLIHNNAAASTEVKVLKKLVDQLDARMNIVIAVLLNGILLWDIKTVKKIEAWRNSQKENFLKWVDVIGEFDAFTSLALYAFNKPHYVFPEISTEQFTIDAENIGHPMLNENKCVKNNYDVVGNAKIDLLTGANMAGKSTFLRTIGVNLLLAMLGLPVCATKFRFTPVQIFTSLRTHDSLQEDESFFYAELKRLRMLITSQQIGHVFFLLDEILKGTNSKDQHLGSEALIKKLIHLKGTGIIATHDVELSKMEIDFPENVRNLCFEIQLINERLQFDYKLKNGVCNTMNASFLMKQMNIID